MHSQIQMNVKYQKKTHLGGKVIKIIIAGSEAGKRTSRGAKGPNTKGSAMPSSCESSEHERHSAELDHAFNT